jgi:hypothetical protein
MTFRLSLSRAAKASFGIRTYVRRRVAAGELASLSLLIAWCVWFYLPILRRMTEPDSGSDYLPHAQWIAQLANGLPLNDFLSHAPHFLFHLTVLLFHLFLPRQSFLEASTLVALLFNILLVVVIYLFLRGFVGKPATFGASLPYVLGSAILTLIMPINLLTPDNLYFGYVAPTVYHNPTMTALKPIAVFLFGLCIPVYSSSKTTTHRIRICAVVTMLCILAKPNYVMAFAPALALLVLYRWWRGQATALSLLLWGVLVPSAVVLGLQIAFFNTSVIALEPLGFLNAHATGTTPDANRYLIMKLILSCAFPLAVYMMYWPATERNTTLILAWLTFGVSLLYAYFLVETNRVTDGNFIWGAQAALFILFMVSLAIFLRENIPLVRGENLRHLMPRLAIGICILGLHLVSGIVWYQTHLVGGMAVMRYW